MTEWRCVVVHPAGPRLEHECVNEADAREWERLERADYPAAEIFVERREVAPWERVPTNDGRAT